MWIYSHGCFFYFNFFLLFVGFFYLLTMHTCVARGHGGIRSNTKEQDVSPLTLSLFSCLTVSCASQNPRPNNPLHELATSMSQISYRCRVSLYNRMTAYFLPCVVCHSPNEEKKERIGRAVNVTKDTCVYVNSATKLLYYSIKPPFFNPNRRLNQAEKRLYKIK